MQDWTRLGCTEMTQFDVRNLTEDTEYHFRVTAVLKDSEDQSEPAETTIPIRTIKLAQKPKVVKTNFSGGEITTVQSGKPLLLEVEASGNPEPEFKWSKDGVVVENNKVVKLGLTVSRVTIEKCQRGVDDGIYW